MINILEIERFKLSSSFFPNQPGLRGLKTPYEETTSITFWWAFIVTRCEFQENKGTLTLPFDYDPLIKFQTLSDYLPTQEAVLNDDHLISRTIRNEYIF